MLRDPPLPDQVNLVSHQDDGPVNAGLHPQLPHSVDGVVVGARVGDGEDDHVGVDGDVLAFYVRMLERKKKKRGGGGRNEKLMFACLLAFIG